MPASGGGIAFCWTPLTQLVGSIDQHFCAGTEERSNQMPRLPLARRGKRLVIQNAPVEFSYFPTYRGTRRAGMHTKVYTTDAWAIIKAAIRQSCPAIDRPTAAAFTDQAEEFYRAAANAQTPHGRPLLLYYAFMNLAKALCLHRENRHVLGKAQHGLEDFNNLAADLAAANVKAFPSDSTVPAPRGPRLNIFHEFLRSATGKGLPAQQTYRMRDVLASSLVGHRLWTEAVDSQDRFLKLIDVEIMHGNASKTLWLRAHIKKSSLSKNGFTQAEVSRGGFSAEWRAVRLRGNEKTDVAVWEQTQQVKYRHRPSDKLEDLAKTARSVFYRSLTTSDPFRNYYVYVPPAGYEKLHQLASRYILLYFLGSVTRYHPADFTAYLDGQYGPFLAEFLASEPSQGLFEMACLFVKREVVSVGLA